MLRKIAILLGFSVLPYQAIASNPDNEGIPEQPVSVMKIVRPIEDYLATTQKPMLLLGCGHNGALDPEAKVSSTLPIQIIMPDRNTGELNRYVSKERTKYTRGLDGTLTHHAHEGWYSVDIDPEMRADVLGDLTQQETFDYIFRPNRFQVVYQELLGAGLLTDDLFRRIATSLLPGGVFVSTFPGLDPSGSIYVGPASELPLVWKMALNVDPGLNFGKNKVFKVRTEYKDLADLNEQMQPFFKHLGFSEVSVHSSNAMYIGVLRMMKADRGQKILFANGKTIPAGELMDQTVNPEAAVIDELFKKVGLGNMYIIAKK